jgi:hypothetical protein
MARDQLLEHLALDAHEAGRRLAHQWRLFGISVATPQVPVQPPQAEAPKDAQPKNAPQKGPAGIEEQVTLSASVSQRALFSRTCRC